jgi:O-antigen ligase
VWCLIGYLVLEYARPPGIVNLRLQMILILAFAVLWLTEPNRPWSKNLSLQTAFLALCALSVVFASNYFSAYMVARILSGHVVIALTITWLLVNRRAFVRFTWCWVLIIAYQAVYALTHAGRGTGGFLGDENDLALACSTAFPFAFVGFRALQGWKRWASGGLAVLFTAAIVASFSRGGFVGFLAAALYCVVTGRNRIRNLLIGLFTGLAFLLVTPDSYKDEIRTIRETSSGTADVRLFLWTAAYRMWLDNPLLGVGAGNSNWNVGRYQPHREPRFARREYEEMDFTMQEVHSLYFELLSETGIVGVAIFGAIIWGHFSALRRLRQVVGRDPAASMDLRSDVQLYGVALAGAMVAYLAAGAFLSVLYYPYPWYLSACAVALARGAGARPRASGERGSAPRG